MSSLKTRSSNNGNGATNASDSDVDSTCAPLKVHSIVNSGITTNGDSIPAHFAPLAVRLVLVSAGLGVLAGGSLLLALPLFYPSTLSSVFLPTSDSTLFGHSSSFRTLASYYLTPNVSQASPLNHIYPQLFLYLHLWSLFHLLEFLITAHWNPTRLMKDSFLLQNGWNYHFAHAAGIVEFLVEAYFFTSPSLQPSSGLGHYYIDKSSPTRSTYLGLLLVLLGQSIRSLSMIHASSNFSHHVASSKRSDHTLVKTGLYGWVRHPSYTGFFLWAMATQVLLGNPVMLVAFAVVLWRFFSSRIRAEEKYLVSFFGQDYVDYKATVTSGIPFVK